MMKPHSHVPNTKHYHLITVNRIMKKKKEKKFNDCKQIKFQPKPLISLSMKFSRRTSTNTFVWLRNEKLRKKKKLYDYSFLWHLECYENGAPTVPQFIPSRKLTGIKRNHFSYVLQYLNNARIESTKYRCFAFNFGIVINCKCSPHYGPGALRYFHAKHGHK